MPIIRKIAKITFTCEPRLREGLEVWARSESRALSNLIEVIAKKAYEDFLIHNPQPEPEPEPEPPTAKPAVAKAKTATAKTKRRKI